MWVIMAGRQAGANIKGGVADEVRMTNDERTGNFAHENTKSFFIPIFGIVRGVEVASCEAVVGCEIGLEHYF
jgi:hypothetical protein